MLNVTESVESVNPVMSGDLCTHSQHICQYVLYTFKCIGSFSKENLIRFKKLKVRILTEKFDFCSGGILVQTDQDWKIYRPELKNCHTL